MDAVNPIYVPRNHLVDEALNAATDGDLEPFTTLSTCCGSPFDERSGLERFARPAPDEFGRGFRTYCGTVTASAEQADHLVVEQAIAADRRVVFVGGRDRADR